MKILIQGRKDGYNILYPKPTPQEFFQFASDIQRIDAGNDARYYGKSFYSIAFNGSGCIFSKFKIGYDVQRCNLGNIGISFFVPVKNKITGSAAKELLDRLVDLYWKDYCPDNYINSDKQEHWNQFDNEAGEYDRKLSSIGDVEPYKQGPKEAAWIVYENEAELCKYLDAPYYKEYKDYKQILFLPDEDLCNVIRHDTTANLTGKIDLDNPEYRLCFPEKTDDGVNITVSVNGDRVSDGSKIRRKDELHIVYSKPYYQKIDEKGKLDELQDYVKVDGQSVTIKQKNLQPETKTFTIKVCDESGEAVEDAVIKQSSSGVDECIISGSSCSIKLSGEDLGKTWTIYAHTKDERLYSSTKTIIPKEQKEEEVLLDLEYQKINIKVLNKDSGAKITSFSVYVDGVKKELEAVDDGAKIKLSVKETKNKCRVRVTSHGYREDSQEFDLSCDKEEITFQLKNEPENKEYKVNAGEHGSFKKGSEYCSKSRYGFDLPDGIIRPDKGWEFTGEYKLQNNTLVAQYRKRSPFYKSLKFIAACVVGILIIGLGIWILSNILKANSPSEDDYSAFKDQVANYVQGDSLILDSLKTYKDRWAGMQPEIKTSGGLCGGGETDSTKYKEWKETLQSIDSAIQKRCHINDKNFAGLKTLQYYPKQACLKEALAKLAPEQYEAVGESLGDISSLTLTQIADSIKAILDRQQSVSLQNPHNASEALSKSISQPHDQVPQQPDTICQKLRSAEVTPDDLKDYKEKYSQYSNSIALYQEFWTKVASEDFEDLELFKGLLENVGEDQVLKDSELAKFLTDICNDTAAFQKFTNTSGRASCKSLEKLKKLYEKP